MTEVRQGWLLMGGIGSGKSEVRRLLNERGVATIDSDALGHRILEPDGAAFVDVSESWPEAVKEGRIDRGSLAAIVFADPVQLARLEELTHPHIFGMIERALQEISGAVVVEIPVLNPRLTRPWKRAIVDSADEARLERLLGRGMTRQQASERMAVQPTRAAWLASADLVIPNHGALADLAVAVDRAVPLLATPPDGA